MKDNPVCLQVNWDQNEEFLHAWTEVNRHWVYLERIYIGMSDDETSRGMIAKQDDFSNINDIIFEIPLVYYLPRLFKRF